jgi:urea carboxylase
MFSKVLIANRGVIAARIERTLRKLGVQSLAVYTEEDRESLHVRGASRAISLGSGSLRDTYLNQDRLIEIALAEGAEAVHPGYGFLSENPDFVRAVEKAGLTFIGPTAEQMEVFGLKHSSREVAERRLVPLLPGSGVLSDLQHALTSAESIGYPVMLKSTAGGGGIGMSLSRSAAELTAAFDRTKRLSGNNFANDAVFLEKFVERARHIEVQVFGDGKGRVIALGERDCSAQRRNQKVMEEAPAPGLTDAERRALHETAVRLMESVSYRNAGTVEFIFDVDTQAFYFLEVNTRLQVEHGVTEAIFGVDLVEWMVLQGAGELPPLAKLKDKLQPRGHAVQARLYAENPLKNFQPSTGLLTRVDFAAEEGLRIDHWIEAGMEISPHYDPMLAKIIAWAPSRELAVDKLSRALGQSRIYGIETNLSYLRALSGSEMFREARVVTASLARFTRQPDLVEVLDGGTQTTIQDYPGRSGYWHVGIPPSGPFDDYSFRLGNRLLGNDEGAAGLECTLNGPRLVFHRTTRALLAGASIKADLDGRPLKLWQAFDIPAGATLSLGEIAGPGCRTYLLISGGIQCPEYLGSKSTFTLGHFGGHAGRALRPGDFLHIGRSLAAPGDAPEQSRAALPELTREWQIRVIPGPQGSPDYFTANDIETIFGASWEVHFNSSRTGVRLMGPKPEWARSDGGEAGLHPSNIHDNAYAVGTLDFTGDMPILLGPDGPSLGGFVCPATVIAADRWKLGQLRAGDTLRFVPVGKLAALAIEDGQDRLIRGLNGEGPAEPVGAEHEAVGTDREPAVIFTSSAHPTGITIRASGEKYLLVEFGEEVLDIALRCRVQALYESLLAKADPAILEMTPGIRSLQVAYDNRRRNPDQMAAKVLEADAELGRLSDFRCPSRIVHLPLSWDDEVCDLAAHKYSQTVRKDAPWCPSNLEFIRRINGLDSVDAVRELIFSASYLVMGLGDVYLGAPVATPMDPRHRLVTTKYNPARTWTAENSVGIGGSYLCVYGMEGPGGYQLFGRTLQMWNRWRRTPVFQQPWLLRFFDQIRFHPVSSQELLEIRRAFPLGEYEPRIEESEFVLADYLDFLAQNRDSIDRFTRTRSQAFRAELDRWNATGQMHFASQEVAHAASADLDIPPGCQPVYASLSGAVWKLSKQPGESVQRGDTLLIAEAMKMEISLASNVAGELVNFRVEEGTIIRPGQIVALVRPAVTEPESSS